MGFWSRRSVPGQAFGTTVVLPSARPEVGKLSMQSSFSLGAPRSDAIQNPTARTLSNVRIDGFLLFSINSSLDVSDRAVTSHEIWPHVMID
jgi:hypothetical protein